MAGMPHSVPVTEGCNVADAGAYWVMTAFATIALTLAFVSLTATTWSGAAPHRA